MACFQRIPPWLAESEFWAGPPSSSTDFGAAAFALRFASREGWLRMSCSIFLNWLMA